MPTSPLKKELKLWFLIPACVVLAVLAFQPLDRAFRSMAYPFQLDYAEGFLAVEAHMISRGQGIYPTLNDYPYLVGNYPPLYPLMQAPFFLLFGPSLFWGRLICFLSGLGIAAAMFFIIHRRTGRILPAILAPLLLINTYALYEWIGYARVDLPAIFFGILGLAILASGQGRPRRTAALVFFLVSIYTKQIQLFAPASGCLWLILRERKTGIRFTAWFLGCAFGIFLLLNLVTGGRYFMHTVVYNANVFDWWQVKAWLRHIFLFYPFSLVTIIFFAIRHFLKWRGTEKRSMTPDLFTIYALFGGLSFLAIGKVGAASNYLIEAHIALYIYLGIRVSMLGDSLEGERVKKQIPAIVVIAVLLNLQAVQLVRTSGSLFSRPNPDRTSLEKGRMMLDIVGRFPDPILCEQPIFQLLAGKEVLFQPFIMAQLQKEGKWDQGAFLEDIRTGRFSLLVTGQDIYGTSHFWQYTGEAIESMRENYELYYRNQPVKRAFMESPSGGIPYYIYIPKKREI